VEFATIQLVDNKVKYDQFKPEQIDALLKEQNVGAAATETSATQ
jgi:20S proteasome subunit alpha 3